MVVAGLRNTSLPLNTAGGSSATRKSAVRRRASAAHPDGQYAFTQPVNPPRKSACSRRPRRRSCEAPTAPTPSELRSAPTAPSGRPRVHLRRQLDPDHSPAARSAASPASPKRSGPRQIAGRPRQHPLGGAATMIEQSRPRLRPRTPRHRPAHDDAPAADHGAGAEDQARQGAEGQGRDDEEARQGQVPLQLPRRRRQLPVPGQAPGAEAAEEGECQRRQEKRAPKPVPFKTCKSPQKLSLKPGATASKSAPCSAGSSTRPRPSAASGSFASSRR